MTATILQFPAKRIASPMERARRTALDALERDEAKRAEHLEKPPFPGGIDDMEF